MDVTRRDADGTERSGSGAMIWHTDGQHYRLAVEAGVSMLVTRLNLLVLTSEGRFDAHGLAPVTYTEKRATRAVTATHFQRAAGRITFSASEASVDLLPGAQDRASLPFQLAALGRADPAQFVGDLDIQVGDNREAAVYRFVLIGQEQLDTPMGTLTTWHLARPARPGSYSTRLDVWLAPQAQWYPVQVRSTEASGAVTTQRVTRIVSREPET
jgi:hypothetical protein